MSKDWLTMPFSEAVLLNPSIPLKRGTVYPFVDMQTVSPSSKKVRSVENRVFAGGGARFAVGDVLMARITPSLEHGKIARFAADNPATIAHGSTEFIVIRGKPDVTDTDFAYYLTRWDYVHSFAVSQMTGSSGRQRVPTDSLQFIDVPVPPLSEQRAIAGILGALDDKIELNRRMNRTLESMARVVFRQWFVDGEEVGDWEVKILGDVLAVLETGSRPKGGATQEPIGVPSVGAESIVKIGYFDFSKTKYVSNEFYESMRRGHVEDRDVLLYKDGGRPGEFEPHVSMFGGGFPFEKFSINEHVYRLRIAPPFSQAYFYFWLESDEIMEEMRNRGTGVAIPGLNSTALSGISISIPPEKLLSDFANYAEPLISKIFANAKESRTLASLRDSLLPKLMRGEVRVSEL